jgi:hypothetical protein
LVGAAIVGAFFRSGTKGLLPDPGAEAGGSAEAGGRPGIDIKTSMYTLIIQYSKIIILQQFDKIFSGL